MDAPSTAVRTNSTPTATSLIAITLPLTASSSRIRHISRPFSIISRGTEQAVSNASAITFSFSTFSSSVDEGSEYAAARGLKHSASFSISTSISSLSFSSLSIYSLTSASTAAYFFFPTVRLPTIIPRDAAAAPPIADAPPPPGTGAPDESSSNQSLFITVIFTPSVIRIIR